jgi:hypothetical protein
MPALPGGVGWGTGVERSGWFFIGRILALLVKEDETERFDWFARPEGILPSIYLPPVENDFGSRTERGNSGTRGADGEEERNSKPLILRRR